MILFHAAPDSPTAEAILAEGFANVGGYYSTDTWWDGVWLFDRPLLATEGASVGGELLIRVDIADEVASDYEWVQQNAVHREWLIPADILNRYPRAIVGDPSEHPL